MQYASHELRPRGKAKLGEEHPHTLDSMNNLALLLQASGGPFPELQTEGCNNA